MSLHWAFQPDLDPRVGSSAADLHVEDADALAAQWSRPGVGGTTRPVGGTPSQLREGSPIDRDNNLIHFGSPLRRE